MLKRIWVGLVAALLPALAMAQGVRYDSQVTTTSAQVGYGALPPVLAVPLAQVTVCKDPACATQAAIYSDAGLTQPLAQPLVTGPRGQFGFWIAPQVVGGTPYYYQVVSPGGAPLGTFPITLTAGANGNVGTLSGTAVPVSEFTQVPRKTLAGFLQALHNAKNQVVNLVVLGDSFSLCDYTNCGTGPTVSANRWPAQLQAHLQAQYGSHGTGVIPVLAVVQNHTVNSDNWSVSGTYDFNTGTLGPSQTGFAAGNALLHLANGAVATFTSSTPFDTVNTYCMTASTSGSLAVVIDGVAAGPACNAASSSAKANVATSSSVALGVHTVTFTSTGDSYLYAAEGTAGTTGVSVHVLAAGGATSLFFGANPATQLAFSDLIPGGTQGTVVMLQTNDASPLFGVSPGQFQTALTAMVAHQQALGSNVLIAVPPADQSAPYEGPYSTAQLAVSLNQNTAYVNVQDRWGTAYNANSGLWDVASGSTAPGVHPNDKGALDEFTMVYASLIDPIVTGGGSGSSACAGNCTFTGQNSMVDTQANRPGLVVQNSNVAGNSAVSVNDSNNIGQISVGFGNANSTILPNQPYVASIGGKGLLITSNLNMPGITVDPVDNHLTLSTGFVQPLITPGSANSKCTQGVATFDANNASYCVAPNTWKQIPLQPYGGSGGSNFSLNNLTGTVTLAAGSNMSLSTSGNTITLSSTGGGSAPTGATNFDVSNLLTTKSFTQNGANRAAMVGALYDSIADPQAQGRTQYACIWNVSDSINAGVVGIERADSPLNQMRSAIANAGLPFAGVGLIPALQVGPSGTVDWNETANNGSLGASDEFGPTQAVGSSSSGQAVHPISVLTGNATAVLQSPAALHYGGTQFTLIGVTDANDVGFDVTIDGTSVGASIGAPASGGTYPAIFKQSFTVAQGDHVVSITPHGGSGTARFYGGEWIANPNGVLIEDLGRGTARSDAYTATNAFAFAPYLTCPKPDAAIISLGTNDGLQSTNTQAQFQANEQSVVNTLQGFNPNVSILILDAHNVASPGSLMTQPQMQAAQKAVAQSTVQSYLSLKDDWGSNTNAGQMGFIYTDGTHESDKGGRYYGSVETGWVLNKVAPNFGGSTITGKTITSSTLDSSPIGATTPSTGKFTSVGVSGNITAGTIAIPNNYVVDSSGDLLVPGGNLLIKGNSAIYLQGSGGINGNGTNSQVTGMTFIATQGNGATMQGSTINATTYQAGGTSGFTGSCASGHTLVVSGGIVTGCN